MHGATLSLSLITQDLHVPAAPRQSSHQWGHFRLLCTDQHLSPCSRNIWEILHLKKPLLTLLTLVSPVSLWEYTTRFVCNQGFLFYQAYVPLLMNSDLLCHILIKSKWFPLNQHRALHPWLSSPFSTSLFQISGGRVHHALQKSTALGIQLAPQRYILLSMDLPWRVTRCPQSQLEPMGDKGTWTVGGLKQVTQANVHPNREASGAAKDMCLNSGGQSLA